MGPLSIFVRSELAALVPYCQDILPVSPSLLVSKIYIVYIYLLASTKKFPGFTEVFRQMILSYFMSFHGFITIPESEPFVPNQCYRQIKKN